jgi:hypothetical protein
LAASPNLMTMAVPSPWADLSAEPLALVRSRCWKRPWNWGSLKASRQLGTLRETSQSGLSEVACEDLCGQSPQAWLGCGSWHRPNKVQFGL